MKFIERFSKAFGLIRVKEIGNLVRVTGVDGLVLKNHFKIMFETDAIAKTMFTNISDTSFSFNRFFIPDVIYMLAKLRHDPKATWSGKRTIDKIVSGLLKDSWFKCSVGPVIPMIDDKRMGALKWPPMPKQLEFLHLFGDKMPRYDLRGYILALAPGLGKDQDLDSLILTDNGWVRMGDITYDDWVIGHDGTSCRITGIYPQGMKDVYRIKLNDGREARCGLEHLWKVRVEGDWKILTLENIMQLESEVGIPIFHRDRENTVSVISDIEYVGKKETQCIEIDHPDHLYITDDYIVTHNTFSALLTASCVIPPNLAEVKIIISPKKALHLVWEKSIRDLLKKTPTYWCCDSGIKMPYDKCEYYIFNFEQIDRAIDLGKHLISRGIRYFVIVDESHNFADYRSARTQKLVTLQTLKDNIYFLWLSGSPILKSAAELTSFLKCSDHRFDADAERRFRRIYLASPGRANEIFNHRLGQMMAFVVGKSAVSTTKPTVKELPVRLPPSLANKFLMSSVREEMKAFIEKRLDFYKDNIKIMRKTVEYWLDYHERTLKSRAERQAFYDYQKNLKMIMRAPDLMMVDILTKARNYERSRLLPSLPPMQRKNFRNALSAVKNIKLKVRGEALGTVLAKRRSECAAALGIYCRPDVIMKESLSKTLFFAGSVLPVKVLEQHLTKLGYEPLLVYAGTNADLTKNIDRFTEDPNVNPICATMQSLSEAVPVIAASTVVLLNRPYRQATYDQVIARADRLGQIHPVTIIEVTLDTGGEPNVSSTTDAILANVRELINDIVGADFAGPDPDERQYKDVIDASTEKPSLAFDDDKLGL